MYMDKTDMHFQYPITCSNKQQHTKSDSNMQ